MQWVMFSNFLRSRPFLLFVILLLSGFLAVHYMSPVSGMNIVLEPLPMRRVSKLVNQTGKNLLYKDQLVLQDNSENSSINVVLKDNRISLQNTKKPVLDDSIKCQKKIDVSFLKVHKAGSTTVMNIFIRFAISNNLNIVLPSKSSGFGFNYLGYGDTVSRKRIVPLPNGNNYNILCNHVVYNKSAFRSILPNDTVYVGILREPVSHFTSAASYYGFYKTVRDRLAGKVPESDIMSTFLSKPAEIQVHTYFVYNRMSYDLGIPKSQFNNETFVDKYIEELSTDYELMMVMEHFHESLVLLKRTLCWDTKDILYVPLNSRSQKSEFTLNEVDLENLRKWNSADFKLYNRFYTIFKNKVESLGQDFQDEVESFKLIQSKVKSFCLLSDGANVEPLLSIEQTKWSGNFVVTHSDCDLMTEHELKTMKRLIDEAWVNYKNSVEE